MQELNVSRPMIVEGKQGLFTVKYVATVEDAHFGKCHLLGVTRDYPDKKMHMIYVVDSLGGIIYTSADKGFKIVNAEPFSWDKPIIADSGSICIGNYLLMSGDQRLLIFKNKKGRITYSTCYINNPPDYLKNYEPEVQYEIKPGDSGFSVFFIGKYVSGVIAHFNREEDAQIFKEAKERKGSCKN